MLMFAQTLSREALLAFHYSTKTVLLVIVPYPLITSLSPINNVETPYIETGLEFLV